MTKSSVKNTPPRRESAFYSAQSTQANRQGSGAGERMTATHAGLIPVKKDTHGDKISAGGKSNTTGPCTAERGRQ
jgi:hypothetical protein